MKIERTVGVSVVSRMGPVESLSDVIKMKTLRDNAAKLADALGVGEWEFLG